MQPVEEVPDERRGGMGEGSGAVAATRARALDGAGRALLDLADEPVRLTAAVQPYTGAEVAEALDALDTSGAAQVVAALPLPMAIAVLDSGVLHDLPDILERITDRWAGQLLEGVTAARRAEIFRTLRPAESLRLRAALSAGARLSLDAMLAGVGRTDSPASLEAAAAASRARRRRRQRRLRRMLWLVALVIALVVVLLSVAAMSADAR